MIRIALETDLPEILAIYEPYVLHSTATFEYDVPSREEFIQRFRDYTRQFPWLVWEEDGKLLGYAYASPPYSRAAYAWCAEPTVYLHPGARGKGIAQKLYAALEKILAMQGYHVLYAIICAENTASLRFHEKCGYRTRVNFPECGYKFGRWLGLVWMEKRLKIGQNPSDKPVPWLSIVQDAERFRNILDSLSLS